VRFLKHLFYGIFYLAILAGIAYLFYIVGLKPAPSCFDQIQNQGETGVDCGGPCAKICTPGLVQPNLSGQAKLFTLPNGLTEALFLAQNPNQNFAIKDFAYEFTIKDASGAIIKTVADHSFIYAAESKYIITPAVYMGSTTPVGADFYATSAVWIKTPDFEAPKFQIQASNIAESSSSLTVTGRLINQDTTTFPSVLLIAVFSNNFGEQIGVGQTTLENIAPGETRNFTIIHLALPDVNLQSPLIFPYALRP
jgi:hypothetical protein